MTEAPGLLMTVLAFILVIGPLVFVHEMGHYWVGRWCGVHAEAFSIGFGPELAAWIDKRGTRWRVGALLLGGYVRFAGDMNPASVNDPKWLELPAAERARSFQGKALWQRALIVLAGPLVNLGLAALILTGFVMAYGENVTPPRIAAVMPGSAAAAAGLREGDSIVAIDGATIDRFDELSQAVLPYPGQAVALTVRRSGETMTVPLTIGTRVEKDRFGTEYRLGQIGVRSVAPVARDVSVIEAPVIAVKQTGSLISMMVEGLGQIITGRRSVSELGGPLKMAQLSGEQAARGPADLILFIALISINLGFINLLPIPMLDGGHLLFYGIEAIQRKPVSARVQEFALRSGVALLLGVMVLVTINDLSSFGIWRGLSRLIG